MENYQVQFRDLLKRAVSEPGTISAAYSAFHNYSIGNQLAALVQCSLRKIPVRPISTLKDWNAKGRFVKRGEKAIYLCMPITGKKTAKDETTGEETTDHYTFFVWKPRWFVLAQTEGQEYKPDAVNAAWDRAKALEALNIEERPFEMVDGNCQGYSHHRVIAINPLAINPLKTTIHEMAHILCGHTTEDRVTDSESTPRHIREAEAESVAFLVGSIIGIENLSDSRGYIQGWLQGDSIPEKSAQKIFRVADQILKAGSNPAERMD
jgi:N-terminal domain of anti-restriction factor ArdC